MRAVYYCRVSTDEETQLNALGHQTQEAESCIISMGWELVEGYIDEGKSGTSTKKRKEYNRLFDDLRTDKFDVIVIKSQDRLMRNTKEWYVFIDALVSYKKKLFFYIENKFYTPDDALLTGIKAILAEEYSRDLSKKIRNAHKTRQEKGSAVLITSATWGYDKVGKSVVINEEEAEVVRLIYNLCLRGYGSRLISKELNERGIKSRTGGYFPEITIRRIIRNPLFKGTAIMNKKTTEFDTKKIIVNHENEWKIHTNAVPAIVSPDIWEEANKIMDGRLLKFNNGSLNTKIVGRYKGKYDLSGKIICGCCGSVYWRKNGFGNIIKKETAAQWMCAEYVKRGRKKTAQDTTSVTGCNNKHIKESNIMKILNDAAGNILIDKKQLIIQHAMSIVMDILSAKSIESEKCENTKIISNIFWKKNLLLDKLLIGTITNEEYKRKDAELENKLAKLLEHKNIIEEKETALSEASERLVDIKHFLTEADISEAQAAKLIRHINKIFVFSEYIEVSFDFRQGMRIPCLSN